jgi:ribosomal protein S18 acetylase RimI-like enzyme
VAALGESPLHGLTRATAAFAALPSVHALPGLTESSQASHSTGPPQSAPASATAPNSVAVCSQKRGDVVFVWGARTREEARGRGLAAQLIDHVESHTRSERLASWLLSTTIPANHTMRRLFRRLGYATLCQVDIWPRWVRGGFLVR